MSEINVSSFIEQQFPSIYREEGEMFIEFVKHYYKWLETESTSPVYQARKFLNNNDIDEAVDEFIVYFKEKYLKNIQLNTATNTSQIVKNSLDLYRSKGSEDSIKLFFDLVFSAPVEVYKPGDDVFKLSDAEYKIPQYLEITPTPLNRTLVRRTIVGLRSGSTAFVEKLIRRRIESGYVEVIYISAVNGYFVAGETIVIRNTEGGFDHFPVVIGSLNELEVYSGGDGWSNGEVVNLTSSTGDSGKAVITKLKAVTGIVEYNLVDGGWGYSADAEINISENMLLLSNVSIHTNANNDVLDNGFVSVSQPLANVQWYSNTDLFRVGDVVYNYYANGTNIGSSVIVSAEYGLTNTTSFFLLSTVSGNTAIDYSAPYYYRAGNTASFRVQNAGHTDLTATANIVGLSSNCTVYASGNSSYFSPGAMVYQQLDYKTFCTATVSNTSVISGNNFSMKLDNISGTIITDVPFIESSYSQTCNVSSIDIIVGVNNINNEFVYVSNNGIYSNVNGVTLDGTVSGISYGNGANFSYSSDLLNVENVNLNVNYLRDYMDESVGSNHLNATSYGVGLNNANLTNKTLASAFTFVNKNIGTIAALTEMNPGSGYAVPPIVNIRDHLVELLYKKDFVIDVDSITGVFVTGERVTQAITGASGIVKSANTTQVRVKRLSLEDKWDVGNANGYLMFGTSTGFTNNPVKISYDIGMVAGRNANVTTSSTFSEKSAQSIKVIDSGFGYNDGSSVDFVSLDGVRAGSAYASCNTNGFGTGYSITTSGFLSEDKKLYDGYYYQDFSYEIKSPITASKYKDMLKNILHVAGTQSFSSIQSVNVISSRASIVQSIFYES